MSVNSRESEPLVFRSLFTSDCTITAYISGQDASNSATLSTVGAPSPATYARAAWAPRGCAAARADYDPLATDDGNKDDLACHRGVTYALLVAAEQAWPERNAKAQVLGAFIYR